MHTTTKVLATPFCFTLIQGVDYNCLIASHLNSPMSANDGGALHLNKAIFCLIALFCLTIILKFFCIAES